MKTQPSELLRRWVLRQAGDQASWFETQLTCLASGTSDRDLHIVLGLAPRKLGKADLQLGEHDFTAAEASCPGWRPRGWSIDGAARISALLVHRSERPFAERFTDLRRTADVSELVALYRGLPLYPRPDALAFDVGEGLRSNISAVFEAIAHDNPFPRDHFDQHRWNHMILKALFVDSRLDRIIGLDKRANPELACILRDYAHERWAAGRSVSPELWRCVGPFAADVNAIDDLMRAFAGAPTERKAAALALHASGTEQAADALALAPMLTGAIASGALSWETLESTLEESA